MTSFMLNENGTLVDSKQLESPVNDIMRIRWEWCRFPVIRKVSMYRRHRLRQVSLWERERDNDDDLILKLHRRVTVVVVVEQGGGLRPQDLYGLCYLSVIVSESDPSTDAFPSSPYGRFLPFPPSSHIFILPSYFLLHTISQTFWSKIWIITLIYICGCKLKK